jgi:flagellar biosynthesis protein FliQ
MATENTSALFTESISACTIAGTVVISEALVTALLVSLVIATTDETLAVAPTEV